MNVAKSDNPLNKKSTDRRGMNNLENGYYSAKVKAIQDRINASPLKEVQKMELNTMTEDMIAKGIAFDLDTVIKSMIIDTMDGTNSKILSYQADMVDTQRKLAEKEAAVQFHRKVLLDLKTQYMSAVTGEEQASILEEIDKREAAIQASEKLYNQILDLRNKMRKELDKKMYQDKVMKIQEEDHDVKMQKEKTIDIDMSVLEG